MAQLPPIWSRSRSPSKCICVRLLFEAAVLGHPEQATPMAPSPAVRTMHQAEGQNHPKPWFGFGVTPAGNRTTDVPL